MAEKKKAPRFTTPTGVAVYPHLSSPDLGNEKFKTRDGGIYHTKLKMKLTAPGVEKLIEDLTALHEASEKKAAEELPALIAKAKAAGKKPPRIPEGSLPFYVDEEAGEVTFSFKMNAQYEDQKTKEIVKIAPVFFSAGGKKLDKAPKVGGGTEMKVAFSVTDYQNSPVAGSGISLKLNAVQIIELVEFGKGGNAESYGFGAEDGFEPDDSDDPFGGDDTPDDDTPAESGASNGSGEDF